MYGATTPNSTIYNVKTFKSAHVSLCLPSCCLAPIFPYTWLQSFLSYTPSAIILYTRVARKKSSSRVWCFIPDSNEYLCMNTFSINYIHSSFDGLICRQHNVVRANQPSDWTDNANLSHLSLSFSLSPSMNVLLLSYMCICMHAWAG